jgi:CRISPR-associated protein (TIGR02584 family)
MIARRNVLVATLGVQAQVVTLAVDLLAEDEGVFVDEVQVVHTAAEDRVGEALNRLRAEFPDNQDYRGRRCPCCLQLISTPDGRPVRDIRTEEDARSAFRTIYRVVLEQKQAGKTVHLSVAGGRNSMVVYGAATAQILFDADDRLWHIVSTAEFEHTCLMHRRSRFEAVLAPIPVLRWSMVSPVLTALVREQDPFRAVVAQEQLAQRQSDRQRVEFLTDELTPTEWRVVGDFVTHSGTDREIADRLDISYRTVGTHLGHVYEKMHAFFGYAVPVNRGTLMQQFAGFFERHPHLRVPPE